MLVIQSVCFVLQCIHFEGMPKCFKCSKELNSLKDLCRHLRHGHLIYEPAPIRCAEGGCCRTFTRYNSFYRHFSTCHCQPAVSASFSTDFSAHDVATNENFSANPVLLSPVDDTVRSVCSTSQSTDEIRDHAAHFLLSLTSSSSVTLSQVKFVKESVSELFSNTVDIVRQSALDLLSSPSDEKVNSFLDVLNKLSKPFESIDSMHKLEKYVMKLPSYVPPTEHVLGQRWHGVNHKQQQNLLDDTFVYVSVQATLKCILHWSRCWEEMVACDAEDCHSDIISSYFSGLNFRQLYRCLKDNISGPFYPVVIQIYYDDFETANPIGSKAGCHKLGAFYFTITNFGQKFNSKLDNIHLVALAKKEDIVYYGMSRIIKPLVKELIDLENGFDVVMEDGSVKHVVCVLGNTVADNLGLHGILGYTESFAHSYCCDFCLGTTDDFQTVFTESNLTVRSRELYRRHCETLQTSGTKTHVFGIKSVCELSQLKYYHPAENDTADLMHDILEGVAPYEINLLLRDVIVTRKLVNIDEFNTMLKCFNYGALMSASKPSEIPLSRLQSSTNLGQHSHQMLVLMYVLPLMISQYITPDNLNWKLFLLLLEITEFVFSPALTAGHLSYLSELIAQHHVLFRKLYPDSRLKYKHHRMIHYPSIILKHGPLSQMWVMRYEAKHGYFKRLAHIMCNFRNVCKTLAGRNQIRQAVVWDKFSHVKSELEIGTGEETVIGAHKEFLTLYCDAASRLQEAFLANTVRVFGTEYEPGFTVIVDMDDNGYPVLGYIVKILVCSNVVSFALRQWKISGFDCRSRSYLCKLSHQILACYQTNLLDYHPLYAHQCLDETCTSYHIRLRHMLCSNN